MCVLPGFSPSLTLSGGRRRGRRSRRKGGLLLREERCESVCAFILLFVFCAVLFLDPAAQKKRKKNLRLPGSPLCAVPAVALGGKPSSYTCCSSVCLCVRCCRDKRVYLCVWLNWNLTAFCWIKGSVPFERCCSDKRGVFPGSALPHRAFTCCNRHKIRYSHALFLLTSLRTVKCQ